MSDHRERYQALSLLMYGQPLRDLFPSRMPRWFGYSLAEVECVASAADVRYTSTKVAEGATMESHVASITILTDELLVLAVGGAEAGEEWHTTTVRSRSGLSSFTISASESALGEWPQSSPGSVDVALTYADGLTVSLPRVDKYPGVLESLLGDLEATPGP